MQPDTAYDIYAKAIWDRDTLLLGVAMIVLVYGIALVVGDRFLPRVMRFAPWLIMGGFYASLALAYFVIR